MKKYLSVGLVMTALGAGGWLFSSQAAVTSASAAEMVVYKSPSCGCCGGWVRHLRQSGFTVEIREREDVVPIKRKLGVPERLDSCHTASIGGYVIEGHVPAKDIRRLLAQKPKASGLAVPGMPMGSPGMEQEGGQKEPYAVILFDGAVKRGVFAKY
ncbi:MAG TPA: DUF411 domain-containing protein [Rhodospirillales bacterium]|nr:DUF411 domain-containing protein [Rhodospirillales bacterium]